MLLKNFTRATTRLLLAAALLVTTAGAAAQGGARAECPMSRMHACCKRARQNRRAPGVAPVRLCCVGNFPPSAPTGSNFTFQSSPGTADSPRPSAAQTPSAIASARPRAYSPPFTPTHAPPAYVRHAAFLI